MAKIKRRSKGMRGKTDSGQYWAESILDWTVAESGVLTYLVKWYGYDSDQNTWEDSNNVGDCDGLLIEFHTITVNGRHPPKWSFDEFDKLFQYLKQLQQKPDLAVYRKLFHTDVDCFEIRKLRTIREVHQFVANHLSHTLEVYEQFKSKDNNERLEAIKLIKRITNTLKIDKNFGSITQFLEFVDRRRVVTKELESWEREINQAILIGEEGKHLNVVNDVDLEKPKLSKYITDYILDTRIEAEIGKEEPLLGCKCKDCYQSQDECCTAVHGFPMAYNSSGKLSFRRYHTLIYECNSKCKCSNQCPNRQIQRGRQYELEIFRSDSEVRGWGVRALQNIPKGAFVCHYTGEVVSLIEAANRQTTYLFDLSAHLSPAENEYTYVVDAYHSGNVTRFINHSCDPNCRVLFAWTERSANRLLPIIALFAIKDIATNEELTYDYAMETNRKNKDCVPLYKMCQQKDKNEDESDKSSPERPKRRKVLCEWIRCECQAINCRKTLYS